MPCTIRLISFLANVYFNDRYRTFFVTIVLLISLVGFSSEQEAVLQCVQSLDDKARQCVMFAGYWNYDYRFSLEAQKRGLKTPLQWRNFFHENLLRNIRGKSWPVTSSGRSPFRSARNHLRDLCSRINNLFVSLLNYSPYIIHWWKPLCIVQLCNLNLFWEKCYHKILSTL
jgi:hypothetical protein